MIGPDHIEAIGDLLREHVRVQHRLLVEVLREYKKAQFEVLESALSAHLKAQNDMVERLLDKLEAVFRAPVNEPERRLDS